MSKVKVYKVNGESMSPYLTSFDQVFIKTEKPKFGDLVLIDIENSLIVHRLVANEQVKGDRVLEKDRHFAILGKVFARQRGKLYTPIENKFSNLLNKIIASLSELNSESKRFRYISLIALIAVCWVQRKIEDLLWGDHA